MSAVTCKQRLLHGKDDGDYLESPYTAVQKSWKITTFKRPPEMSKVVQF